ncbi:MAG: hypothetical protein ACYDBB_19315 [Armatimonadota bacterium]
MNPLFVNAIRAARRTAARWHHGPSPHSTTPSKLPSPPPYEEDAGTRPKDQPRSFWQRFWSRLRQADHLMFIL